MTVAAPPARPAAPAGPAGAHSGAGTSSVPFDAALAAVTGTGADSAQQPGPDRAGTEDATTTAPTVAAPIVTVSASLVDPALLGALPVPAPAPTDLVDAAASATGAPTAPAAGATALAPAPAGAAVAALGVVAAGRTTEEIAGSAGSASVPPAPAPVPSTPSSSTAPAASGAASGAATSSPLTTATGMPGRVPAAQPVGPATPAPADAPADAPALAAAPATPTPGGGLPAAAPQRDAAEAVRPGQPAAAATAATTGAPVVSTGPATGGRTGHGADRGPSGQGDPGLPAVLPTRGGETPFVVPTPASAAPATVAGSATANAPAPLAQQLARPLFTLAQAGPGEHVVTVQVSPDALGPVTVRAHVTAHGMHVELFAASDAGRDAVRQVLPDLRRDAAGSTVATTLDLSSQNHPDAQPGRDDRRTPGGFRPEAGPEARPTTTAPVTTRPTTVRSVGLDVLA
ncbi:flagellar hook-length control protein FliK [Curtobacterium sp. ER1/6]|uniref:flagellar hook-length control protein FliK n=1 Tax=Curtobacterium sp. ER1/6 TaxID=1891920 RepID=UPI001CB973FE|nr:flagellar hook-length control protein FliK [Curtobacterium sp. ER1/6]